MHVGGTKFVLFFPTVIFISGCLSNHYERTENFSFFWKIGDFANAALEAEKLATEGLKRDRMLYRLEEGATKRIQGDFDGSIKALEHASNEYDKWFGIHLKSKTSVSEEFISTIGSPEWKPYKSRVYERVMLRLYQALNFFATGEKERARAQIFKTRQAIQDAREIWKMELEASRQAMKRRSIDLDEVTRLLRKNNLSNEMDRMKKMIPANLPEYINPAALYFESIFFLHGAKQRDDFEKAEFSLRQLLSIHSTNEWIIEDYQQASDRVFTKNENTYIFFETGRAAVRREKRYDLPVLFFSATSRIPYLGLAFPVLMTNDNFLAGLEVIDESGDGITQTLPLADLDAIISLEFARNFPIELAKAIAGSLGKGSLQYLGTNAVYDQKDLPRAVTGVGVGTLAAALTQADLRSWTTLPKQIQFCKIPTPESQRLTLQGVNTNLSIRVPLKKATTNIVWIKSVSPYTPLQLINVFPLDA